MSRKVSGLVGLCSVLDAADDAILLTHYLLATVPTWATPVGMPPCSKVTYEADCCWLRNGFTFALIAYFPRPTRARRAGFQHSPLYTWRSDRSGDYRGVRCSPGTLGRAGP